jgi:hypothetical protein
MKSEDSAWYLAMYQSINVLKDYGIGLRNDLPKGEKTLYMLASQFITYMSLAEQLLKQMETLHKEIK